MHDLVNLLLDLPAPLIWLLAAALVTAETAVIFGLVLPAEATLLLVGFLTYTGTLRLGPTLVVMILAAVVGDSLAFRSGHRYGPRLRAGGFGARVGAARWERADSLLGRLGGRGVMAARWLAFARTLAPRLAGAAGMPYRRFLPWNVVGAVTWVSASVLVGYLAGESYATVSRLLGQATGALLVLLGCLVAIVLVGRWLGRNPDPVRALLARAAGLPPVRWLRNRYGVLFFLVSMRVGPAWTVVVNLVAGSALLFAAGFVVTWLFDTVVRYSGLGGVDGAIAGWFADRRTPHAVEVASTVVSVARGSVLIVVVAVVAAVSTWRSRSWRGDLLGVLGTAGAFVPLVMLAVVARLTGPDQDGPVFASEQAVVTAGLCTLAWLAVREVRWPVAVAVWTGAVVGVVGIGVARLYLGSGSVSAMVTAILLGAAWPAMFMVAWATRARVVPGVPPDATVPGGAVSGGPDEGPPGRVAGVDGRVAGVDGVEGVR